MQCPSLKGAVDRDLQCPLHRSSASVIWQQAGVNVERAMPWDAQEACGKDVAVRSSDAQVWFQAP